MPSARTWFIELAARVHLLTGLSLLAHGCEPEHPSQRVNPRVQPLAQGSADATAQTGCEAFHACVRDYIKVAPTWDTAQDLSAARACVDRAYATRRVDSCGSIQLGTATRSGRPVEARLVLDRSGDVVGGMRLHVVYAGFDASSALASLACACDGGWLPISMQGWSRRVIPGECHVSQQAPHGDLKVVRQELDQASPYAPRGIHQLHFEAHGIHAAALELLGLEQGMQAGIVGMDRSKADDLGALALSERYGRSLPGRLQLRTQGKAIELKRASDEGFWALIESIPWNDGSAPAACYLQGPATHTLSYRHGGVVRTSSFHPRCADGGVDLLRQVAARVHALPLGGPCTDTEASLQELACSQAMASSRSLTLEAPDMTIRVVDPAVASLGCALMRDAHD